MRTYYRRKRKKSRPVNISISKRYRRDAQKLMAFAAIFVFGLIVLILFIKLIVWAFFGIRVNQIDIEYMRVSPDEIVHLSEICEEKSTDMSVALTAYCLEHSFFPEKQSPRTKEQMELDFYPKIEKIKNKMSEKNFQKYYAVIDTLLKEMKYFPIPNGYALNSYMFGDTWNTKRDMCGIFNHRGVDIYDRENQPGKIPVLSIATGVVEEKGKSKSGNWHLGIRTERGTYYYYDHFDSISDSLDVGSTAAAGSLLGYMGNGGKASSEDVKGHFPTNIHIGIKVKSDLRKGEFWINPYPFMRYLDALKETELLESEV